MEGLTPGTESEYLEDIAYVLSTSAEDWASVAAADWDYLLASMKVMGISSLATLGPLVREVAGELVAGKGEFWPTVPYIVDKLRQWVSGIHISVNGSEQRKLLVPLFILNAPGVDGSVASYQRVESRSRESRWKLAFRGIGIASKQSFTFVDKCKMAVADKESKLIRIPVMVEYQSVSVYEGGRLLGEGIRVVVIPPQAGSRENLRSDSIPWDPYVPVRGRADRTEEWDLLRDHGSLPSEYSVKLSSGTECHFQVSLGGSPGPELSLETTASLIEEIEVGMKLPGGYRHQMTWLEGPFGIRWRPQQ
ncbi:MAG: hypothetical protein IT335_10375 [Thermomicrobiales bacterium]|nr:hypothetical protein [Thermomicrobiales bacterium]